MTRLAAVPPASLVVGLLLMNALHHFDDVDGVVALDWRDISRLKRLDHVPSVQHNEQLMEAPSDLGASFSRARVLALNPTARGPLSSVIGPSSQHGQIDEGAIASPLHAFRNLPGNNLGDLLRLLNETTAFEQCVPSSIHHDLAFVYAASRQADNTMVIRMNVRSHNFVPFSNTGILHGSSVGRIRRWLASRARPVSAFPRRRSEARWNS